MWNFQHAAKPGWNKQFARDKNYSPVASHSPPDQLSIEKNTRGTSLMFARPHLTV